jgi:hypothetical protein
MVTFAYNAEAESVRLSKRWPRERPAAHRRFARAADAIRFAEELPPALLVGASLEVDEERFNGNGIRQLYQSAEYSLNRRAQGARLSHTANA